MNQQAVMYLARFYPNQVTRMMLEALHTKQLLTVLNWHRLTTAPSFVDLLRDILSTREHVPNKVEAKMIRKAKMKAKRNR